MSDKGPNHNIKRVRDLLVKARTLKQLTRQSQQLEQLNQRFLSRLPSMLAQYCRLKEYRNGQLIVRAYSAAVATQLRFTTPQIMMQLRKMPEFAALQRLDIQVGTPQPATSPKSSRPARKRQAVSSTATAMLRDTAASLDADELAASLRKLARTLDQLRD